MSAASRNCASSGRRRCEYAGDRPADGGRGASGHTTLASTDREGRPVRLPDEMRRTLEAVLEPGAPAPAGKNAPSAAVQGRAS